MLRFLRSHISPHQFRTENIAEFIDYSKHGKHGFPRGVSCLAVDEQLSLLAVGTVHGELKLYGDENTEFSFTLADPKPLTDIYFVPGKGQLIAVSNGSNAPITDHFFYKFEIDGTTLKCTQAPTHNCLKKITCFEMMDVEENTQLLLGTVTGNVFALSPETLELEEWVIFENTELKNISDLTEKSITQIIVDKHDPQKITLVLDALVIVLYDLQHDIIQLMLHPLQRISKVFFERDFIYCAFPDGSYQKFNAKNGKSLESKMPFGPYPCTRIDKLIILTDSPLSREITIFSGGMPNASFGDRITVSVLSAERNVVLDLGSDIVDFAVVRGSVDKDIFPTALIILCKEELVAIDLLDSKWRPFNLPYLFPLHYSPLSCLSVVDDVPDHIFNQLEECGLKHSGISSPRKWPIRHKQSSKTAVRNEHVHRQIYLTGHEDGSVNAWIGDQKSLRRIISFNCCSLFDGYHKEEHEKEVFDSNDGALISDASTSDADLQESRDWPPFRKTGLYDMYYDDTDVSVSAVSFDQRSGDIAVAGQRGQILIFRLHAESQVHASVHQISINLFENAEQKPKDSTCALMVREGSYIYRKGYHPLSIDSDDEKKSVVIQIKPSLPITALGYKQMSGRSIVAAGNEHGFVVIDASSGQILQQRCLTNEIEHAPITDVSTMSRFKSMKKSIRKSFRRKKKTTTDGNNSTANESQPEEFRPIERRIVARSEAASSRETKTIPASLVRVIRFHQACITSCNESSDSLWIGTYGGVVYLFSFAFDERKETHCVLVKELKLKHGAPVIGIDCCNFYHSLGGEDSVVQRVVISTEEQIRSFSLPSLKAAKFKCKLAGIEGSRIRRTAVARLRSSQGDNSETFFIATSNRGEFFFFPMSSPKQHFKVTYLSPTDIAEIISTVVATNGDVVYVLPSASELQKATVSTVASSCREEQRTCRRLNH